LRFARFLLPLSRILRVHVFHRRKPALRIPLAFLAPLLLLLSPWLLWALVARV
jgi:hypothetical protein